MTAQQVRIESIAAGGDGVGHLPDGRVVFVPLTAVGDRVSVRVIEMRARHARAELVEVLEPGEGRTAPRCPVFGECGGCAWQHLLYAEQLEAKRGIVYDALRRIGRIEWSGTLEIAASPQPYGYRGRARVRVEGGRVGYRRRGSHALCAVEGCPVLVPELERRLAELAAQPPLDDGEWELVAGRDGVRAARLAAGQGKRVFLDIAGDDLRLSTGVFAQSNLLLHETLAARVLERCGRGTLALELHAGAGFFTLGLSRRFAGVVAVEAQAAAVRDLRANLEAAGRHNVRVIESDVGDAAWGPVAAPDAVLVDPPRVGLSRGLLERLVALAPQRLVYLACDPATLARDLARFVEAGLALQHVEAFDLFPQTPHVEVLAVLEAGPAGG